MNNDAERKEFLAPSNRQISDALQEVANLLEAQGANPFRVAAYRSAALTVRQLDKPAQTLLELEGIAGLMKLDRIGKSLANAISQLIRTGRLSLLDRLRGDDQVERVFATVPDVGPELARRIHESLGIETLSELQAAANDGRLASVPGMGDKRMRAVRESLAGRFQIARSRPAAKQAQPLDQGVPVSELLEIDAEYLRLAKSGALPCIAPRRFNPTGAAWLPIMHTQRDERHYTVLFSNTAHAHDMGAIRDWVIIYRDDSSDHGCWTAITAQFGKLRGQRIIRGRESECAAHYELQRIIPCALNLGRAHLRQVDGLKSYTLARRN